MVQPQSQWGRYQLQGSVMMMLLKMPAAWFQLSILFLSPDINFRCHNNSNTNSQHDNVMFDSTTELWDNSCSSNNKSCYHWQYDRQEIANTVNMEWDLICDKEMLNTWAQIALMVGISSGNALGGLLACRVGRKPVLVVAVVLQPLMSAIVAVVPTFSLFVIFRFLLGLSLGGTMVISFLLGAELGNGPHRPAITILHQVPFGIGQTLLAVTAHFLRDWREVQMALSLYCVIFLPYCCLMEESPQWLLATGRLKRAERVTAAIQRRNGVSEASIIEMHPMANKQKIKVVKKENGKLINNGIAAEPVEVGFWHLFHTPRLRRYSLSIWLMWYCAGLSFFALNAYQTQLGGNNPINVGVGGLIGGIPGNIVTIYLVRKFGRKNVIVIGHILISLCAILIPLYNVGESPWDWQRRVLGLLTLVAMSVAYPALFLFSGELIPTVVRGFAMPIANLMARLGNTTAPLVGLTAVFHQWLPLCIIAASPLLTLALMTTLPETAQQPLPQTIQDVENHNRWKENVIIGMKEEDKVYKPVQDS